MTSSALIHRLDVRQIPDLAYDAWRADLLARLQAGSRLVTLYGQRNGEDVTITAVFIERERSLSISRTVVNASAGYRELTSELPAVHCFERELAEQTGLFMADHPWLKPIRSQGRAEFAMSAYSYYRVEGKEVHEVAVGPIHAGVIEPGSFRFSCFGEQVHHLEIQLGYQHRGVERRLLEGKPLDLAPLVETIAGDTSIGHTWAYCAAIESLAECEIGLEVDVGRALALELERVAMHLAGLSGLAADIGLLQGATTYGRLRTIVINTTMRLCGSRFGRGALRPGGVRLRLDSELAKDISANVELVRKDLAPINELFLTARTVQHRLRGVGVLTTAQASELGIVGLVARASGLRLDTRSDGKEGAYQLLRIHPTVLMDGDCLARAQVRIEELETSLAWITAVLDRYADWQQPLQPVAELAPNQLVVALVEGFRGEIVHCLETGSAGELCHYKVQDPSLRNWMGLALAVRSNEISDFPICNKSFDLSYCGSDL